ncbi:MAG: GntP family permease [Burkholderiaceae bacterium]|nr:GntP family permease [Burkholderiaceae bacterium]
MMDIVGMVLALVLLMALAYRGVSVLLLAPLMALLATLFSADTPLLASYTQVFMPALGGFVVMFFPLFLLGAVFGKLMEDSGAAQVIARGMVAQLGEQRAILAIVLACAVLTYGGVSLFVVAFAVYPIATSLFRQANLPKRLIPATIALGAFTFTMTALPGTPAIQNAIPMPYFGTTPFAAPGLGLIGGGVMLVLGTLWLVRRAAAATARGEGYGEHDEPQAPPSDPASTFANPASTNAGTTDSGTAAGTAQAARAPGMPFGAAVAPVVLVIGLNYLLATWVLPALDTSYLADPRYGATTIGHVRGLWAVVAALTAAIAWLVVLQRRQLPQLGHTLEQGATSSVLPLLNTASQVGFGAVIASLAGFALVRDAVLTIAPDNPLVSMSIAVNILAGITGSASGGMSIALQTLGETWLAMGQAAGIAPDLLHRVTAIATGGLDALPHNGAVITLLGICGLSHREAYGDIFVVAVAIPVLALVIVVVLGSTFGSF